MPHGIPFEEMNRANPLFKPSKISISIYDEFIAAGKPHYAKAAGSDTFVLFGLQLGKLFVGFQTWRRQADSRGDSIKNRVRSADAAETA